MSDTLITEEQVRERFSIAPEISVVATCVATASRQLKSWVGATAYADASLGDRATNPDRAAQLTDAESYLAAYHTLLNAGLRLRPAGVVKQEQDAAGPMGGTVLNQYVTPKELSELRKQYFEQAQELAAPYRVQAGTKCAGTISMQGAYRQ